MKIRYAILISISIALALNYAVIRRNYITLNVMNLVLSSDASLVSVMQSSPISFEKHQTAESMCQMAEQSTDSGSTVLWGWIACLVSGNEVLTENLRERSYQNTSIAFDRKRTIEVVHQYRMKNHTALLSTSCESPTLQNLWISLANTTEDIQTKLTFYDIGLNCPIEETDSISSDLSLNSTVAGLQFYDYARLLAEAGKYDESLAAYRRAVEFAPEHPAILFWYARKKWDWGNKENASDVLEILERVEGLPGCGQYCAHARDLRVAIAGFSNRE